MSKLKKVVKIIKLQIPAGKANPAPPIGPALGAKGDFFLDEHSRPSMDMALDK